MSPHEYKLSGSQNHLNDRLLGFWSEFLGQDVNTFCEWCLWILWVPRCTRCEGALKPQTHLINYLHWKHLNTMFMLFVFRGGGDTRLEILGTRPMLQNKTYGDNNTTYGANKTVSHSVRLLLGTHTRHSVWLLTKLTRPNWILQDWIKIMIFYKINAKIYINILLSLTFII